MTRTTTEQLTLRLQHSTVSDAEQFRNVINNRSSNNVFELPYITSYGDTSTTDSEMVINLNNTTTSERREVLMNNILKYQDSSETRLELLSNSSLAVRSYLNQLLVRASSNGLVTEDQLHQIGNLFLYTLATTTGIDTVYDALVPLRESLFVHNMNGAHSLIIRERDLHQEAVTQFLQTHRINSEEILENCKKMFEEQQIQARNRNIMIGLAGAVTSFGLASIGWGPIGSILVRRLIPTLTSSAASQVFGGSSLVQSSSDFSESIRLRDVWDEGLKKIHEFLKGCL
jgi:hypothetical protein